MLCLGEKMLDRVILEVKTQDSAVDVAIKQTQIDSASHTL
jgi:hypothetical protein